MYRRKEEGDKWHWCENCQNWPTENFEEQYNRPDNGQLCQKCTENSNKGTCELGTSSSMKKFED